MVSPDSKGSLDLLVCPPTEKNLVVYQKCMPFNILFAAGRMAEFIVDIIFYPQQRDGVQFLLSKFDNASFCASQIVLPLKAEVPSISIGVLVDCLPIYCLTKQI